MRGCIDELRIARDRQNGSAEILRAIAGASGDAEQSLQQIAETTARLFGASSVTLNIASGNEWARMIRVGPSSQRVGSKLSATELGIGGRNLPATVFRENRQIHIPDLDNLDPAIADWPSLPHARGAGARAMVGTPLRREGKAIGALIVHRDRPVPFTEEELALLQSFADQAVIAIENTRLFNETREALEREAATAEILKVINSSPGDLAPVFDAILEKATLLCGASFSVLSVYDGDDMHQVVAMRGVPSELAGMFHGPVHLGPETGLGRLVCGESFVAHPRRSDDEGYRPVTGASRPGRRCAGPAPTWPCRSAETRAFSDPITSIAGKSGVSPGS